MAFYSIFLISLPKPLVDFGFFKFEFLGNSLDLVLLHSLSVLWFYLLLILFLKELWFQRVHPLSGYLADYPGVGVAHLHIEQLCDFFVQEPSSSNSVDLALNEILNITVICLTPFLDTEPFLDPLWFILIKICIFWLDFILLFNMLTSSPRFIILIPRIIVSFWWIQTQTLSIHQISSAYLDQLWLRLNRANFNFLCLVLILKNELVLVRTHFFINLQRLGVTSLWRIELLFIILSLLDLFVSFSLRIFLAVDKEIQIW